MGISDIISTTIDLADRVPATANFGIPMIMAYHGLWRNSEVRTYDADTSGLAALVVDGFTATSNVYRMASAICSQTPHCEKFKVGSRTSPFIGKWDVTPTSTTEGQHITFTVTVDGTPTVIDYVVLAAPNNTVAVTVAALRLLVNAVAGLTSTNDTTHLSITCVQGVTFTVGTLTNATALETSTGAHTIDMTPTATGTDPEVGEVYSFDVSANGAAVVSCEYVAVPGDTLEDVVDGLVAELATSGVTVVDGTTKLTLSLPAGQRVLLKNATRNLTVEDVSTDSAGIATDLAAAALADEDWFAFAIDCTSKAGILAAGAWAQANGKIFAAQTGDTETLDSGVTDCVLSELHALTEHYVYCVPTRDNYGCVAAGLAALVLAYYPGQASWAYKTVSGAIADRFTASELAAVKAKFGLAYTVTKGMSHTFDGWATSGRYLDITHGLAWMCEQIRVGILALLLNNPRVPYTDSGAAQVEGVLQGVLSQAAAAPYNLIDAGWSTSVPKISSLSTVQRASRVLPNATAIFRLKGAIHKVIFQGFGSV